MLKLTQLNGNPQYIRQDAIKSMFRLEEEGHVSSSLERKRSLGTSARR